jgi:TonB family protein
MLRMNRALYTVVMALALAGAVFAGDDKQAVDALIKKAVASADLLRSGVPHTIRASFELSNLKDKPKGQYQRVFASQNNWAEVIRLDKYSESTVVKDGAMWKTRPQPYDNQAIRALHMAFDPMNYFEGIPYKQIDATWQEKVGGNAAKCARYKHEMALSEVCANSDTGQLVRLNHQEFETSLGDHVEFSGKQVPRSITVKYRGKVVARVTMESITPTVESERSFEPPMSATKMPYCSSSRYTVPIITRTARGAPHYPEEARQSRLEGTVIIAVVIQADGLVRPVAVLQSAGKALDDGSWQTIARWKYVPGTCDGKPIDSEEAIQISYSLAN